MLTEDYTVRLESFEGPLDLLLYLIRRAEVEIADIPIAEITDQYMQHLRGIERVDVDVAGEFLVMAATLVEIKSRTLAPRPAGEQPVDGEPDAAGVFEADPREELVHQLIAYKRSRDAAETLDRMRAEWERRFPTNPAAIDRAALAEARPAPDDLDLDDLALYDLVEAFGRIVAQVNFDALGDHRVSIDEDDVPLEEHAADIEDQLRNSAAAQLTLRAIFTGRSRIEMIGLFLALLELVRKRAITVRQPEPGGEIVLERAEAVAGTQ